MDMEKSKIRCAVGNRRGKAGETLAETLVAMLIIGLSSVLFATMVGAASRIFETAKTGYEEICTDVTVAETMQESSKLTDGLGKITVAGIDSAGASSSVDVEVNWYRNQEKEDSVLSYK